MLKNRTLKRTISCILIAMCAVSCSAVSAAADENFEENYALFEDDIRECTEIAGFSQIAFFDLTGDGRPELLAVYAAEQVDFSTVLNVIDYDAGSLGTVPCSYGTIKGYYDGAVIISGGHMDDYFSTIVKWDGENLKAEDLNRVDTSQITDPDERDRVMEEGLLAGLDMEQYTPAERVFLHMVDGNVERL